MNKQDYVKSLSKVKLVIGNGFDLHCGLHTTYSDYYCKNYKKYLFVQNLYSKYEKTDELNLDFQDNKISFLNVWDIFFALNSSKNPKVCKQRWCDIEKMILASLQRRDYSESNADVVSLSLFSKINWNEIEKLVISNGMATNHIDRFVHTFVKEKMKLKKLHPASFYQFLLDELKSFEKQFGNFIYSQLHDCYLERLNHGVMFPNQAYICMAIDTLMELCSEDNLVGIDSFNYSYINNGKINNLYQHINGSYASPIFGIDTLFEPNQSEFIFTKTSRRIDSDLIDPSFVKKPEFENLIIYGHSLDEADYSYFFPAFDKLQLTDSLASNVIVFAYSIFDETKEIEIKSELRQAISKVMFAYAKSKNLLNPKRFLDSLSSQKRIITYEIPLLNKGNYMYTFVDQEWDKIYKEIDNLLVTKDYE